VDAEGIEQAEGFAPELKGNDLLLRYTPRVGE
jgi:hypothetical protein